MRRRTSKRPSHGLGVVAMGLYDFIVFAALLVYAPIAFWRLCKDPRYRARFAKGLRQRTGRVPPSSGRRPVVWVHGVSVGEIKAAGTLIRRIREEYPDLQLVISSTTPTGHALAEDLYPRDHVIFYPIDFGRCPARVLDRVRPELVLLMELEIWPNFLQASAKRGIPVYVINGRISIRSFRGYRMAHVLFMPPLHLIAGFFVQDVPYQQRLLALDVGSRRTFVTGNMKYDGVTPKEPGDEVVGLRAWLSPRGQQVLVCGSTHQQEELWLAKITRRLMRDLGLPLRLVMVPRHPQRSPSVCVALEAEGMRCVPWTSLSTPPRTLADEEVLIVDTIGQLESFYGACDIAFVGGSLVPHGGQNMLEPAALGKAVVFGPHTENFTTDVRLLLEAEAAFQVSDLEGLERRLRELVRSPETRERMGQRAIEVIRANQGATERTLRLLRPVLASLAARSTPPAQPADSAEADSGEQEQETDEPDPEEGQDQTGLVQRQNT